MEASDLVKAWERQSFSLDTPKSLKQIGFFDRSCLVALLFLLVANILEAIERNNFPRLEFDKLKELDPDAIKTTFRNRNSWHFFFDFASMFSAIALFALLIPIFQVSWILSRGGKRKITLHITLFIVALAGGLCELIAQLLMAGVRGMASFLSTRFEMDNWSLNDSGNDAVGWRALEIAYMMTRSLTTWVNAFECLSLFGIYTILFILVSAEKKEVKEGAVTFNKAWAALGLGIGLFSVIEFTSELLRTQSWFFWMRFSHVIAIINLWILIPVWLIMLGIKLPQMRKAHCNNEQEVLLSNEHNNPAFSISEDDDDLSIDDE